MKVFYTKSTSEIVKEKHVFLDNDFLSELFNDENIFLDILALTADGILMLDPYIEFEFLRDIYLPEQRMIKEQFLRIEVFNPVADHQIIYSQIQENALLLPKIYSHQHQNNKISFVDLLLAARVMYYQKTALLITGNKKDFPPCIFDLMAVLNIEKKNDLNIKSYSVLKFNQKKFENCLADLSKLENK